MKERRNEFDLIRAISTLAIVLFHYSYAFTQYGVLGSHIDFMMHANGTWGALFVSLFFMLSGASLYYNWGDRLRGFTGKGGVLDFYKKRFLSIYPMFYIGWSACYLMYVISFDFLWNWGGPYKKLLLTLFGVDGYFLYRGLNYYTIGEWFLGAIIMLYVLYPLLQWGANKIPAVFTAVIVLLFALNTGRRLIPALAAYNARIIISDNINIITCLLSFWIGILLTRLGRLSENQFTQSARPRFAGKSDTNLGHVARYASQIRSVSPQTDDAHLGQSVFGQSAGRKLINRTSACISLVLGILIMIMPLPVSTLILSPALAVCFYIVLSFVSIFFDAHLKKRKTYDTVIGFISKYSYPIFLIHHVTIQKMLQLFTGREVSFLFSILYFFVTLAVIAVLSVALSKLTKLVLSLLSGLRSQTSS